MFSRRKFLTAAGLITTGWLGGVLLERVKANAPARLRPPGALSEPEFLATCIRCGQCVQACPYHTLSLTTAESGIALATPDLDSRRVPCYLCQGYNELKCIAACPSSALRPVANWASIRMGTAVLNRDTCLVWQGTPCRACWHACPFPNEAIVLDLRGRAIVQADQCIGCGLCDHACLTEPSSIPIRPRGVA